MVFLVWPKSMAEAMGFPMPQRRYVLNTPKVGHRSLVPLPLGRYNWIHRVYICIYVYIPMDPWPLSEKVRLTP